ncbi:SpoIIE family protein phosphatase [Streptomyces pacificus]|uniref:PAS domain-containing protein n=1 Tax=Streptomyces pacificus TaxID=2705029 RepID=A0A6A0B1E3_9ACTN|nr:SpoIIE family protein phosphatase [Streptomyces pacificus]GFH39079.1 PAS domain-containing protein [Streptomyces pacificus]
MGTGGVPRRGVGRGHNAAGGWATIVVDARGMVTGWSPSARRLLGHPADRVLGRPAVELLATATEGAARGAAPAPAAPPATGTGPAAAAGPGSEPAPPPAAEPASRDLAEPGLPPEPDPPPAAEAGFGSVLLRHGNGGLVACRIGIRPAAADGPDAGWEVLLGPAATEPAPETELDKALLEALFTRSPVGLFVVDPRLRLIRVNPAAEGMQGAAVEAALGKRPRDVWPEFSADVAERVMGRVLRTGRPVIGWEKRGKPPGDPHREHVYSTSSFRLEDAEGRVLGGAEAAVDVTERHRAQERLTLLAEGGARIGTSLEVMRTAQELAEVTVPRLADSMAVEVLEEVLAGEEVFPGPVRPGAVLRRAASLAAGPAEPAGVYADGEVSSFPSAAPALDALTDLRPRLVGSVAADSAWVLKDPARGARILQDGVHSLMVVPLVAQERVLGVATFYRWGAQGPFGDDDLTLATELAGRTALCLDNTRRYLRERNTLLALQRSLLPGELPHHHGVEVAHEYVHAGTGGDWVDVVPLSGARVALVAGSVPGRGVATAAAMGRLRAAVHTLSDLDLDPEELLARMDDLVRRLGGGDGTREAFAGRRSGGGERPPAGASGTQAADEARAPATGEETGCTCLYLTYDPISQRCAVASAGHPAPALAHPDGTVRLIGVPAAAPLGRPGAPLRRTEVDLPENAVLVLYTPGLLQAGADGAPPGPPGPSRRASMGRADPSGAGGPGGPRTAGNEPGWPSDRWADGDGPPDERLGGGNTPAAEGTGPAAPSDGAGPAASSGGDAAEQAGARLLGILARAPGSVRETCRMLPEALMPAHPRQDAALLVARTHALGPGRVASWDLPGDPAVVSTARSLVTRQLSAWALDDAAFATELIASELVTNAIRYADAPIRLRLIRDHVLTCEVSDGSSTSPRLRHARTTDEGGRGLLLVARCSERWGTRYTENGKTIWAEQAVV